MQRLELKPTHKPVQNYYAALRQFDDLGVTHETAVRSAFQGPLDHCAHQNDWPLLAQVITVSLETVESIKHLLPLER